MQDYLEYVLQTQIVAEAKTNRGVQQSILGDTREGVEGGALTDADRQPAEISTPNRVAATNIMQFVQQL